jgi:hypothetical protein
MSEMKAGSIRKVLMTYEDDMTTGPEEGVLCPVCGEFYVHKGAPYILRGKDGYEATGDHFVRGDVTVIPFICENGGHRWQLQLGFHKGQVYMRVVIQDTHEDFPGESGYAPYSF